VESAGEKIRQGLLTQRRRFSRLALLYLAKACGNFFGKRFIAERLNGTGNCPLLAADEQLPAT
jgi:hypothetical protein